MSGRESSAPAGRDQKVRRRAKTGATVTAIGVAIAVLGLALLQREPPHRCTPRVVREHRCCWPGQRLEAGKCLGTPDDCPDPYRSHGELCTLPPARVPIAGGSVHLAPNDWQAAGTVVDQWISVGAFLLDRTEVRIGAGPEPDLPRTNLSPQQAELACRRRGGRLPTIEEWMFAAAGPEGHRYPWGQTGLVCRRAVYGLSRGPCANSESPGPDAVGSRPSGATPEGVFDLAGNVAEWVRAEDSYVAMGGSFRSRLASELKIWSKEARTDPAPHIGFRCLYPPGSAD